MTLVRAERALGYESRLVTFFRDPRGYEEDVCLQLPLVTSPLVQQIKRRVAPRQRMEVRNVQAPPRSTPPVWQPAGQFEAALFRLREWLWTPRIRRMMREMDFWNFDLYQFDAGLDFFRNGRTVQALRRRGKPVVVSYTGSDFRTRGILPPVDGNADLRITFEWDHLELDDRLVHLPVPFEPEKFTYRERRAEGRPLRIGHAPTNRAAKGSEAILQILNGLAARHEIDIVLIENRPHAEALALKDRCDLFIDQIGELGYGINALEALAMGIPTCTGLVPAFKTAYPDHPFVEVQAENLEQALERLIADAEWRRQLARRGREWVERVHDSRRVVQRIHALLEAARGGPEAGAEPPLQERKAG